ncbi:MAG: PAS domain-containing protein [Alphaproteobacteria bacterium]|nr:PAS domain-containing protein [Alphaproteobacteria bacterium]
MLYGNSNLTGVERSFPTSEIIVSKTDLTGKLVYGNNTFYDLAGMTEKECLNQQHNIVRHPHMPRSVFDLLWETIKGGEEIFSYVVNRSKNGDHYWVFAHVTPSVNTSGTIIGYHSNRRAPNKTVVNEKIQPLYKELIALESNAASPKQGILAGRNRIRQILDETKMDFNELMFSFGL